MDISYIPFTFPNVPKVRAIFQTRVGGVSQNAYGGGNISFSTDDDKQCILKNRQSLEKTVGHNLSELFQIHGDNLIFDPEPIAMDALPKYEADGQATSKSGLGLIIKTADCQPILICHKAGGHIMALHVGWRGNRCAFILSAIHKFCENYNLLAKDLLAVRGPSLGPPMAEFINFDSEWGNEFKPWFSVHEKTMDLWSLTRHQLQQAGLLSANIFGLDMCTVSMNELFFSYRVEKQSGRQASIIWIAP